MYSSKKMLILYKIYRSKNWFGCSVQNLYRVNCINITVTRRASLVSNSYFFYKTEGLRVKDGGTEGAG